MNILVTGGSGFIGSSLVSSLIRRPDINQVIVIDIADKPHYLEHKKIVWIKCSFLEVPSNEEVLTNISQYSIDVVFHLATTMFPKKSIENPVRDLLENGAKSVSFCESMYNLGAEKLIYASSGGLIYGNNPDNTVFDEESILSPTISYGMIKKINEDYLTLISRSQGRKFVSLRISNPYGIMQNKVGTQGVIPIFMNSVLSGLPITLSESDLSRRDYIYIDDLISIFNKALDYKGSETVFNAASGISHSLKEVIERIEYITSSKANINKTNEDRISNVILSNKKALVELGWEPNVALDEGIEMLFNNFVRKEKIEE